MVWIPHPAPPHLPPKPQTISLPGWSHWDSVPIHNPVINHYHTFPRPQFCLSSRHLEQDFKGRLVSTKMAKHDCFQQIFPDFSQLKDLIPSHEEALVSGSYQVKSGTCTRNPSQQGRWCGLRQWTPPRRSLFWGHRQLAAQPTVMQWSKANLGSHVCKREGQRDKSVQRDSASTYLRQIQGNWVSICLSSAQNP